MRITNNMLNTGYLKNLNNNLENMSLLQNQVATGKEITKMSDDPTGVVLSMQYSAKLVKLEQYSGNISNAQTLMEQTESSVMELNEVFKDAYETVVEVSNEYMSQDEIIAAAELVGQLRDQIVTIGNAQSGNKYIFGGYNTTNAPFSVDASGNILYNGLDLTNDSDPALIAESTQTMSYQIGYETEMDVSINGTDLLGMGDGNLYTVLDDLYNLMTSGSASKEELGNYIETLQDSQSEILATAAKLGGKSNRLELIANRYEEDILNYKDIISNIVDVDEAEAAMNFKMAEVVYNASLEIGSYIIQPSLADFLD